MKRRIPQKKCTNVTIFLTVFCAANFCEAEEITFCNKIDCYQIEQEVVDKKVNQCLYQAKLEMLVLHWKQINNWKQVEYVGAGNQKIIHCLPKIPNKFLTGEETNEQLQFLEKLRCRIQNKKRDAVFHQIDYFNWCMSRFEPEQFVDQ
tara:strand:- start:4011 stop:4454 length:444 start_codon:yes stop_codon:yes gene_type:complete